MDDFINSDKILRFRFYGFGFVLSLLIELDSVDFVG